MCSKLFMPRSATQRESPPVFVLRKLSDTTQLAVEDLQVLFRLLKEVAFHFREGENSRPNFTARWCREPIVSDEMYNRWSRQKRQLKKVIREHEAIYEQLRHRQKTCINSVKKVKKYSNLMDIATGLEDCDADTEDVSDNKYSVTEIKTHLTKKLSSHDKKFALYEHVLQQEQDIRRNMLDGRQLDADQVAKNLYSVICRKYCFYIPVNGIDCNAFNQQLPVAWHIDSRLVIPDYDFTYGNGKLGLVVEDSNGEERNYLKLSKDDIVKQKLVSADGSVGFGWTRPTKFSMKKWGFYPIDALFFA